MGLGLRNVETELNALKLNSLFRILNSKVKTTTSIIAEDWLAKQSYSKDNNHCLYIQPDNPYLKHINTLLKKYNCSLNTNIQQIDYSERALYPAFYLSKTLDRLKTCYHSTTIQTLLEQDNTFISRRKARQLNLELGESELENVRKHICSGSRPYKLRSDIEELLDHLQQKQQQQQQNNNLINEEENALTWTIFTDGSCQAPTTHLSPSLETLLPKSPNRIKAGCGVYIPPPPPPQPNDNNTTLVIDEATFLSTNPTASCNSFSFRVNNTQTINNAELSAINKALRSVPPNHHLTIKTDSQVSIDVTRIVTQANSITPILGQPFAPVALDILNIINTRNINNATTKLEKIKAHLKVNDESSLEDRQNIFGNDQADALAKASLNLDDPTPNTNPLPFFFTTNFTPETEHERFIPNIKRYVRMVDQNSNHIEWSKKSTQNKMLSTNFDKQLYRIIIKKMPNYLFKFQRQLYITTGPWRHSIFIMKQITSGHCLYCMDNNINPEDPPMDSPFHTLFECPQAWSLIDPIQECFNKAFEKQRFRISPTESWLSHFTDNNTNTAYLMLMGTPPTTFSSIFNTYFYRCKNTVMYHSLCQQLFTSLGNFGSSYTLPVTTHAYVAKTSNKASGSNTNFITD
ncbi:hypothetical protein DFA_12206 [Cavenderia fasciculata]|uniref:ribonuclease H n=1 Tax=Cavenderia fasciculata TaxID=261658 RepID=F4QCK6_CACFS|nr:uncharacterized protein DFA_12206 [Cavenderia fasciculata]EGG14434.1 hypothetical protein DFA_12206 [Cavenderia fasciculata]|eukprot:XP_004353843.1 hypothetical protein DFA_12206 [Cavenderia fasciculata]